MKTFLLLLLLATGSPRLEADNLLFFGNSFTFGASAAGLPEHGGVPQLVEEIARSRGRPWHTFSVTAPGQDWSYHLARPATARALRSRVWTWVILQDFSTRPTRIGNIPQFMADGATFSDRIAQTSPQAGIVLYETWARPPGAFYHGPPGAAFSSPAQMMQDLHGSYELLRQDLAARNRNRAVRVALVGTAFARCAAQNPAIPLDAPDHHHTTIEGYYLAALVIYETLSQESVSGAPTSFFHGLLTIPPAEAAKLQRIADGVAGRQAEPN